MRTGKMPAGAAVAFGVMLFCPGAPAEEEEAVHPVVAAAVARAKAEIALWEARDTVDGNRSGWEKARRSVRPLYNEINGLLENARRKEETKKEDEGEVKDQGFIDDCRQKQGEMHRKWQEFDNREQRDLEARFRAAGHIYGQLRQAFDQMRQGMELFKRAGCDATGYVLVHEAIRKRAEEVRNDAEVVLDDVKAELREWEAALEDVKEFVGVAPEEETGVL